MERESVKDLDPVQDSVYEQTVRYYREGMERQKTGKLLIRGDERMHQGVS